MSQSHKTKNPTQPSPSTHNRAPKHRAPLAVINAAAVLLLAACGTDSEVPNGGRTAETTVSVPSASAEATSSVPVPAPAPAPTQTPIQTPKAPKPSASPVTEAAPNAALQELMTARAAKGAAELSQSILSFAATLSPEAAPVEPAGDDGSMLQYARVDVPAEDGTLTHYEMYTQYLEQGAGLDPVIESVNIQVNYQDAAGNVTETPYWLSVWKNPEGTGQAVSLSGSGEGGPFAISDDFSGAPGLNAGETPILTLADEEAVFAQAGSVIRNARNGLYFQAESAPF